MALHQIAYLQHLLHSVEIACGVIGIANQYPFGTGTYQSLELLHGRQLETVVNSRRNSHYLGAGRYGESHIVGIRRLRHYYLVAGVQTGHKSEKDCLGASCGDYHIVCLHIDMEAPVIFAQFLAQRQQSGRRAVLQHLSVDFLQSLEGFGRRGHVGLPYVQPIYFYSPGHGLIGQRHEPADWGGRHFLAAMRYLGHTCIQV